MYRYIDIDEPKWAMGKEKAIFLRCVGDVGVSRALGSPQNRRRECRDQQHSPPATAAPLNVTLAYVEALSDPGRLSLSKVD